MVCTTKQKAWAGGRCLPGLYATLFVKTDVPLNPERASSATL